MAFRDLWNELRGITATLPAPYAKTLVNRALEKIYNETLWSFQLGTSGWVTPALVGVGTVTTTQFSDQVVGDAAASAAWLAISGRPFITERQFRNPAYAIYDIVAMDATVPTAVVLTLDRPWMEPVFGANQPYMIYQPYQVAPVEDFKRFITVRDFTNNAKLDFRQYKQSDLAALDPQRTIFNLSQYVVPLGTDTRANSATPGWMRFELWPQPTSNFAYALAWVRRGDFLVNPGDTVPYPLTESVVIWRAKQLAFEYKEAQKGEDVARGSGADWKFLMQEARAEYDSSLAEVKRLDRDLYDLFFTKLRRNLPQAGAGFYSAVTGTATV